MRTNKHRERYVKKLSSESRETLTEMWRNHRQFRARNRAQMVLLSDEGMSRRTVARIGKVEVDTVSQVYDNWEQYGLVGLFDAPKSGRPPALDKAERERAKELVAQDPRNPNQALAQLQVEIGRTVHPKTFKRALKSAGLVWKRLRRSLKMKRDPEKFAHAQQDLAHFHLQEERGEIDVFYFDESGFTLNSSVPYGWQPSGEQTLLPANWGKRFNVLGFCNRFDDFFSETVVGRVDSQRVVDCFNRFLPTLTRPTVVVLDNAKIHRSKLFAQQLPIWADAGLAVYFLPTYSPELNLIEIVWRFIKYRWLPLSAFLNTASLGAALEHILSHFGSDDDYRISFG